MFSPSFYILFLHSFVFLRSENNNEFLRSENNNPLRTIEISTGMEDREVIATNMGHHSRIGRQALFAPNSRVGSPVVVTGPPPVPVPRPSLSNRPVDPQEELLRNERINKGFERMLQFVTVAGQVDSYLTDRAKYFVNRLSKLTEEDDRLQSRRSKCG